MRSLTESFLCDSYDSAESKPPRRATFTGFSGMQTLTIDYILVSGFKVIAYSERHDKRAHSDRRPSDHAAVLAQLLPLYATPA